MNTAILEDDEHDRVDPRINEGSGVHPCEQKKLSPRDQIAGKYAIHATIGAGGFAVVYDAEHLGLGRNVAIKVMHLDAETPLALVERFRNEARISALVHHPNVLEVYDTGTLTDGSPYLVMERIYGETLHQRMQRQRLTIPAAVEVARQVLTALMALSELGIVHRDIKPENLMLHTTGDGHTLVKVVDFGISRNLLTGPEARLTRTGALIGTPHYMSPEQIRGEDVDARADLYALGVVMYEALSGHVPHDGATLNALVLSTLNGDIPPIRETRPNCPEALEQIVLRALSRKREERYVSAASMLADLEAFSWELALARGAEAFQVPDLPVPGLTRLRRHHETLQDGPRASAVQYPYADTARSERAPRRSRKLRITSARDLRRTLLSVALTLAGVICLVRFAPSAFHAAPATSATMQVVPASTPPHAVADPVPSSLKPVVSPKPHSAEPVPVVSSLANNVPEPTPEARARHHGRARSRARVDREDQRDEGVVEFAAIEARRPAPSPEPLFASRGQASTSKPPTVATDAVPELLPQRADEPKPHARDNASRTRALRVEQPNPAEAQALLDEALASYVLGRFSRAYGLYRQAVRLYPNRADAQRGLGLAAARLGETANARKALERYLQLAPAAPDRNAIRARLASLP